MRAQHMDQFLLRTLSDLVVAGALGLVLLAYRQQPASSQRRRALHESLAGFSYSLYAIHLPVVMLVCVSLEAGLGFGWQERPTSLAAVALGCACFVAAVAAGYGLSRVTEAHTDRARRFVLDRALRSRLSIPTP